MPDPCTAHTSVPNVINIDGVTKESLEPALDYRRYLKSNPDKLAIQVFSKGLAKAAAKAKRLARSAAEAAAEAATDATEGSGAGAGPDAGDAAAGDAATAPPVPEDNGVDDPWAVPAFSDLKETAKSIPCLKVRAHIGVLGAAPLMFSVPPAPPSGHYSAQSSQHCLPATCSHP